MQKLPEISTKKGDKGTTKNYSKESVRKNCAQMKCIAFIDLFTASMGLFVNDVESYVPQILEDFVRLQGEIATSELNQSWYKQKITENDVDKLEAECAKIKAKLEKENYEIKGWVNSGSEGKLSASIDFSSKFCRVAEGSIYDLEDTMEGEINPEIKKYINRLSDYLYWLARENRVS
jgi:cob(I)alamin adenosyltransferase